MASSSETLDRLAGVTGQRWATCEEGALDFALRCPAEAAGRDPRITGVIRSGIRAVRAGNADPSASGG